MSSNFKTHITSALDQFESKPQTADLDLIVETLKKSGAYEADDEIQATAMEIDRSIDSISSGYSEILEYKKQGRSTKQWLLDKLSHLQEKHPEIKHLAGTVSSSLALAQDDLAQELGLSPLKTAQSPELKPGDALEKNATADKILRSTQTLTQVQSIIQAQIPKMEGLEQIKEIAQVKATFDAKLGDPSEDRLKKAVATGLEIARKKNLLPAKMAQCAPNEIAAIVDSGLTGAKVAYKVAQGKLSPVDAAEIIVDRAASRLNTVIVQTCAKTGAKVGRTLGAAVGAVFGPVGAAVGGAVGQALGYIAGKVVGETIAKGVEKIASVAKSVINSAWEGAKSVCSSVWESVSSIFS